MSPSLSELLKLPAGERAELAMALWESLSSAERETEMEARGRRGIGPALGGPCSAARVRDFLAGSPPEADSSRVNRVRILGTDAIRVGP